MTARPLRRRAASTRRPPRVDMRTRNPWVFARLRLLGWNVLFTFITPFRSQVVAGRWSRRESGRAGAEPSDCSRAHARVSTKGCWIGLRSPPARLSRRAHPGPPPAWSARGPVLLSLPIASRKKLQKLWILWKTQDSRALGLWITRSGRLLPPGGSVRIGDARGGHLRRSPHLENTLSDG
jgi:hypothetical protein